jgi:hypothetical protein
MSATELPDPAAPDAQPRPDAPSKELVVVPRGWRPPAAIDIGIDLASSVTRGVVLVTRTGLRMAAPVARFALRPPMVSQRRSPASYLATMADHGRIVREHGEEQLLARLRVAVPAVVGAVLDLIDLNQVVIERIDFEKVISAIDFEKVIAAVDVGQIVRSLDIDSIAREVLVSIDLPELIRESSGAMASETVVGVRLRGIEADERVAGIIDKLMRRRQGRAARPDLQPTTDASPAAEPAKGLSVDG